MISEADKYVHLTPNALKNISLKGSVYPLRDQKLVLLGEDEAYIEEAIRERECVCGGGREEFAEIAKTDDEGNIIYDSNGDQIKTTYHNETFPRYDRRIRVVKTDYKDLIDRIRASGWYDKKKFAEIPQSDSTLVNVKEKYTREDEEDALKEYWDSVDNASEAEEEANKTHNEELEKKGKEHSDNLTKLEENKKTKISQAKTDYEQFEAPDKESQQEDERKSHESRVKNILSDYENDRITAKERNNLLAKEEDEYTLKLTKIDREYAEAILNNERTYENTLAEIHNKWLEDYNKENREYAKWLEDTEKAHKKNIDKIRNSVSAGSILYLGNNSVGYSDTSAYKERQKLFDKAKITKSCTEPCFEKFAGHDPSSTVLNRIYGDLEHMTLTQSVSYAIRRCGHKFGDKIYKEGEDSSLVSERNDQKKECDNYNYALYAGNKRCYKNNDGAYVITKVTADAIVTITGESVKSKAYNEALQELKKGLGEKLIASGLKQGENWDWDQLGDIIWITPPNDEEKNLVESFYEEVDSLEPPIEERFIQTVCQPVTFLPKSIPYQSEFSSIDSAFDEYLEKVKKENAVQEKKYHDLKIEHLKKVDEIEENYKDALKTAEDNLNKALEDAHKSFLDSLVGDVIMINDKCIDVDRKIATLPSGSEIPGGRTSTQIVEDWVENVYNKAYTKWIEEISNANDDYDNEKKLAETSYNENMASEDRNYSDEKKKIRDDKEHAKKLKHLLDEHGASLNSIRESLKAKEDAAKEKYDKAIADAYAKWNEGYDAAYKAAAQYTDKGYELANNWDINISFSGGFQLDQSTLKELEWCPDAAEIIELFDNADKAARPIFEAADNALEADKRNAETERDKAIMSIPYFDLNKRVRYETTIKPIEGPGIGDADSYSSDCYLEDFENIVFHLEGMNTLTGVDFQKYYDEQFPEEEEKDME